MYLSMFLIRSARRAVRSVLIPALALLLVLGLTSGGSGSVTLTPSASRIASELQLHHRLPADTMLSMGKKADPLTARIDADGRIALKTPRTANFGGLLSSGIGEAMKLASSRQFEIPTTASAAAKP